MSRDEGDGPAAPWLDEALVQNIRAWVAARRTEIVAYLGRLVELESPSTDPSLQGPVMEALGSRLQAAGYRTRRLRGRDSGGMLYAHPALRERHASVQMLLGHCDTVWPEGTLREMPLRVEDDVIHGPGVYDMKAGLTQAVFALEALHTLRLEPKVTPVLLVNSDEEIGSHESTCTIRRLAALSNRVFVLEPSLTPAGRIKTTRKGVGRFTIEIHGRAAHAGLDPERGASAILELSHVVQELFALNDPARGVTVNVGQIDGGVRPNVIAPRSRAVVDVRVPTQQDAARVERAIHGLRPTTPGVELVIEGNVGRPPLEPTPRNRALWHLASQTGRALGLSLAEGSAGGGSDGNTTSQHAATLDGLGAVGDGAHATHEHARIPELIERTALLALLLLAPPLRAEDNDTGHTDRTAQASEESGP